MNKDDEKVSHPQYYGGENNIYEAIKVIQAWDLDFALGNVVKYIARAGKKDPEKELEDLEKAAQYLDFEIRARKKAGEAKKANEKHNMNGSYIQCSTCSNALSIDGRDPAIKGWQIRQVYGPEMWNVTCPYCLNKRRMRTERRMF